ncbi:MAG: hypothetical protein LBC27_02405 [Spirochaetaceae bacterium]|jgi:hypothetical protein|nr:hypothetical protein [Spirochaetaceae bacterium]
MKKKILVIAAALFVFASVEAFSFGLGVRGNWGYDGIGGGSLLFSPNRDFHFGLSYYIGDVLHLGLTADWWFYEWELAGPLSLYIGAGLYGWVWLGDDVNTGLGVRVPVGLDLNPTDWLEIFLEIAPQIGVGLLPSVGISGNWISASIGIRFWIAE